MSWSSGSRLFSEVISAIKENVEDEGTREIIYLALIPVFEAEDCDTLDECLGEDYPFDLAYAASYPEQEDDDD
jgi:hypothetical protein